MARCKLQETVNFAFRASTTAFVVAPEFVVNYESRVQAMSRPTYRAIKTHCENKEPAIVFAPTRKHAKQRALELLSAAMRDNDEGYFRSVSEDENVLEQLSEKIESDAGVKRDDFWHRRHRGVIQSRKTSAVLSIPECNAYFVDDLRLGVRVDFTTKSKTRRRFGDITLRCRVLPP